MENDNFNQKYDKLLKLIVASKTQTHTFNLDVNLKIKYVLTIQFQYVLKWILF
jgi:hypothetical protein